MLFQYLSGLISAKVWQQANYGSCWFAVDVDDDDDSSFLYLLSANYVADIILVLNVAHWANTEKPLAAWNFHSSK